MRRLIVAVSLAMLPGSAFGQTERTISPQQVLESTLADLRNRADELAFAKKGPPLPFAPWTTPPLPPLTPGAETVSLASLSHRVPKAAIKAHNRGVKFARAGDTRRAIVEMEKAVASDPQYAEARGMLAALKAPER